MISFKWNTNKKQKDEINVRGTLAEWLSIGFPTQRSRFQILLSASAAGY